MRTVVVFMLSLIILSSCSKSMRPKTQLSWLVNSQGKKIRKEEEKHFNEKGDIDKMIQYIDNDVICETFTYEYSSGLKTKETNVRCDGKGATTTIYTYDYADRLTNKIVYDANHKLILKDVSVYNGNSNHPASVDAFSGKEKEPFNHTDFQYYPNGLKKSEESSTESHNYKYDSNGNLIYEDGVADEGVGLVRYYYTYKDNVLVKDVVKVPGSRPEHHIYETIYQ